MIVGLKTLESVLRQRLASSNRFRRRLFVLLHTHACFDENRMGANNKERHTASILRVDYQQLLIARPSLHYLPSIRKYKEFVTVPCVPLLQYARSIGG